MAKESNLMGGNVQTDFAQWYAVVSLQSDDAHREVRWKGVQNASQGVTRPTMETLVRLAFRSRQQVASGELAALRNKMAGEAGPPGDEELILLAAATLAHILQKGDSSSAMAATLITVANFGGFRSLKQPMDLVGMATNTITLLADSSRRRQAFTLGKAPTTNVDPADAVEKSKSVDSANMAAAFTSLAVSFNAAVASIARRQQQFEQAVQKHVRIQDEELDMLWWLQAGRSLSLNIPFADIEPNQRPLVLARELADATFALPGPLTIDALLSRAGIADDVPITITAAVQSLTSQWLADAIPEDRIARVSPVTTPIHEAIKRRLEVHGADTWIPAWASVCDLDQGGQLSTLRLAELAYREHLLVRFE
jgi:hypothetical protein